jgi:hypothetical protein
MSETLLFIAASAALVGQGFDVITTDAGLSHGWKETNSLVAKVISKVGFPVFAFIKVAGFGIGLTLGINAINPTAGIIVGFASAGVGLYAGIRNYILLKKNKIAL